MSGRSSTNDYVHLLAARAVELFAFVASRGARHKMPKAIS